METILIIIVVAAIIFFLVKKLSNSKPNPNPNSNPNPQAYTDYFEQHGVRVNFKEGTIKIKQYTYNVNQVTGLRTISGGSLGTVKGVEIQVDDFEKPIHKIVIGGFGNTQEKFTQRLSIALRKAGGPSFV